MAEYGRRNKTEQKELTEKLLKERCKNKPGEDSQQMLKDFQQKNQRERITVRS
jgi:hypothetical protein